MRAICVSIAFWFCVTHVSIADEITGGQILESWEKSSFNEIVCSFDIRKVPDNANAVVPNAKLEGRFCWKDGLGTRLKEEVDLTETKGTLYSVIQNKNGDIPQVTIVPTSQQDIKSMLLANCLLYWLKPSDTDLGEILRTRKEKNFEIQLDNALGEHVVLSRRNGRSEHLWTLSKHHGWRPVKYEVFVDEVLSRRNVFKYSMVDGRLQLVKLEFGGILFAMDLGNVSIGSPQFLQKISQGIIGTSHITLRETKFECADAEFKVDLRAKRVIDTQTNADYVVAADGSTHNFTKEEYREAGSFKKLLEREGLLNVEQK